MTPQTNTTVLITGANKGIGYATARGLLALGWTVWLAARDETRGAAAEAALASEALPGTLRLVSLDVTSDDSVAAAVGTVRETGLDVLINNAGIASMKPTRETVAADFLPVFGVNVLGPIRVTHAFLPLLEQSSHPRIVNVSSSVGSFAVTTDPANFEATLDSVVYPSSKTTLNMITSQYAKALPGMRVNAVCPGYTATDLNGHRGFQTPEQGARAVVAAAQIGSDGPTGTFFDADGPVGW